MKGRKKRKRERNLQAIVGDGERKKFEEITVKRVRELVGLVEAPETEGN